MSFPRGSSFALSGTLTISALALLTGCGGGGGAATGSGDPGGVTATAGFLSVRASGNGPGTPVVMGSRNAVVTGFAGAAYSTATVTLPGYGSLPETDQIRHRKIYHSTNGVPFLFDAFSYRQIALSGGGQEKNEFGRLSLARNGSKLVYSLIGFSGFGLQAYVSDPDGSNPVLWSSIDSFIDLAMSADGKKVYFTKGGSNKIHVASSATGSTIVLPATLAGSSYNTIFDVSRDGQWLLVHAFDGSQNHLQVVSTTTTTVTTLRTRTADWEDGAFSDDGRRVLIADQNLLTTYDNTTNPQQTDLFVLGAGEGSFVAISWMPDNRTIAAARRLPDDSGSVGFIDSLNPSLSPLFQTGGFSRSLSTAPYISYRTLVGGSTGIMSGCSAILYSQVGSSFGSFLAIDATNRSASTVISQDNPVGNQSVIVATLVAGASNKFLGIKYINDLAEPARTGGNLSNFDGAVVTLDADSGEIIAVLPYNGSKSSQRIVREGDSVRIQGEFLGVFDAKGKNLAEGGASGVVVGANVVKVTG